VSVRWVSVVIGATKECRENIKKGVVSEEENII
jgi:hypothetical protein